MARPRSVPDERLPEPSDSPVSTEKPPAESPYDRLTVLIGKDGKIAFDNMRASTKARLMETIAKSGLAAASAGPSGAVPDQAAQMLAPLCAAAAGALGTIAMAMAIKAGYSPESAMMLMYSESEKEAIGQLTPAALAEWSIVIKYPATWALVAALVGPLGAKAIGLQVAGKPSAFEHDLRDIRPA